MSESCFVGPHMIFSHARSSSQSLLSLNQYSYHDVWTGVEGTLPLMRGSCSDCCPRPVYMCLQIIKLSFISAVQRYLVTIFINTAALKDHPDNSDGRKPIINQ